ncbi:acyltransferase family protein [Rhizobium sp. BK181]|uniref:acyltransferase family protein n=1 Tax=Rhizobium sp. BK181 TaxID=2587072 RepID=UPI0016160753|nr:acyltransferase [Rhizobium sp. BK181]
MKRVRFLDGLRGWGALVVVLYHVFCNGFPENDFFRNYLWRFVPMNGPFAVMVFFVVSGFALSIGFIQSRDFRQLGTIAATRYFRLALPILLACAVVHLAQVTGVLQVPAERFPPWGNIVAFPASLEHLSRFSFYDVFFNYSLSETYIGPLWTMSFELVGSFVAIAAILFATLIRLRLLFLAVVAAYFLAVGSMNFLFVAGVIVALLYQSGRLNGIPSSVGLGGLGATTVYLLAFQWSEGRLDMVASIIFILGCMIVYQARDFLSNRLSRHLGTISFPLYLMHGPVMLIFGAPMMGQFGDTVVSRSVIQVLMVTVSFLAAYAFVPVNNAVISCLRKVSSPLIATPAVGVGWLDRRRERLSGRP